MRKTIAILLVFMFFLVSCASPAVPPTETPVPSLTLTPTLTSTPSPTETVTLTPTPQLPPEITQGIKDGWVLSADGNTYFNPEKGINTFTKNNKGEWVPFDNSIPIDVNRDGMPDTEYSGVVKEQHYVDVPTGNRVIFGKNNSSIGKMPERDFYTVILSEGYYTGYKIVEITDKNTSLKAEWVFFTMKYFHKDKSSVEIELAESKLFFDKGKQLLGKDKLGVQHLITIDLPEDSSFSKQHYSLVRSYTPMNDLDANLMFPSNANWLKPTDVLDSIRNSTGFIDYRFGGYVLGPYPNP